MSIINNVGTNLALGGLVGTSGSNSTGKPKKPLNLSKVTCATWRTLVGKPISMEHDVSGVQATRDFLRRVTRMAKRDSSSSSSCCCVDLSLSVTSPASQSVAVEKPSPTVTATEEEEEEGGGSSWSVLVRMRVPWPEEEGVVGDDDEEKRHVVVDVVGECSTSVILMAGNTKI